MKIYHLVTVDILRNSLISLGVTLLGVATLGQWTPLGNYTSYPARSWECFDLELAKKTPNLDLLYQAAQLRSPKPFEELKSAEVMQILYETTACRFTHGDEIGEHTLFSNWLLWSLGNFQPNFKIHYDVNHLLKYGHSGFCSQISAVLMSLAQRAGIPARLVHLEGHVVMEAWYNDDWHMYDADKEVVAKHHGDVVSVEELSRDKALAFTTYKIRPDTDRWVNSITTRLDNFADEVYRINSFAFMQFLNTSEFLKFLLPLVLVISGLRIDIYKK